MVRIAVSLIFAMLAPLAAAAEPSTQPVAQTGAFEITFTNRSPQSAREKLLGRFGDPGIGPDYDLSHQPFLVYVPADFSSDKPLGIVVYTTADGATQTPETLQPVLDKRHLIFIIAKSSQLSVGAEAGLSIDAVYNLKARYPIDDRRVFLMGTSWIEYVGLATPDIFAGDVWIWNTFYWRSFPINRTQIYAAMGGPPSDRMLELAKHRPHVFGFETDNYNDGIRSLIPGVMTHDGFEHMFKAVIAADDISYPNLKPQWFGNMLDMLESVTLAPSKSTTRPTDPGIAATSLFNLAQAYQAAGRTDLAREKLELLIQKYPNDPAAAKAKDLLSQMP